MAHALAGCDVAAVHRTLLDIALVGVHARARCGTPTAAAYDAKALDAALL